jgi:hypothetical protein
MLRLKPRISPTLRISPMLRPKLRISPTLRAHAGRHLLSFVSATPAAAGRQVVVASS